MPGKMATVRRETLFVLLFDGLELTLRIVTCRGLQLFRPIRATSDP